MEEQEVLEINISDVIADMWLEIEELKSILKIICCALKNPQDDRPEINDIESILFSLNGKLNNLGNNLNIVEEIISTD
jgi:hypothetical protein